jgi:hypothetical protein
MSKHLIFEKMIWKSTAIDWHKWLTVPNALIMDCPSDYFLSAARFAAE